MTMKTPIIRYFRLLDTAHKGTIVRTDGPYQESFSKAKGWTRDGILIRYQSPESDTYGDFEEITEREALQAIKK